ncbi:hypothetical protein B0H19DRAFT_1061657 [Mycena capillaripes]|nr:hypothetical protein B0H19DRAFT_1061657 [Mycena capillaripes]
MRFLTPLLCVFIAVPSVLALKPQEIIDTLNALRDQANAITPEFEKLSDPKTQSTRQDLLAPLDALTTLSADYIRFSENVGTTQGQILDQNTANALAQAATQHSEAVSTMAVAVARGLFKYNTSSHDLYTKGCDAGVKIGVHAIVLFTVLGAKFPNAITVVVLQGLLEVVRLPLKEPSAIGCFVTILPPIVPPGI